MHFMDALQYPMQDKGWLGKLAILVVLLFIPIFGWFIIGGYELRLIQRIYRREPGLPEWDDWGGDLTRGFMAFVGGLIYAIPNIIIACCNAGLGQSDSGGAAALSCLLNFISLGYSLLITPLLFSAIAHYAATEDFSAFTNIAGRIQDATGNLNNTLMLYVDLIIFYIIAWIIVAIGILLCCIPGLLAMAATSLALYYIIAQWGIQIGAAGGAGPQYMGPPPQQGFSF
ncbi:MAG: hypothetical protein BroJett018_28820 [Chloroflexota bacterium]|nr:DUF4013 domain-containing protein [Chloroflexota bacterium]GIK65088.1 MAG: hypothetical protein BroJett018_28820 [Chloroflexota bacterium]